MSETAPQQAPTDDQSAGDRTRAHDAGWLGFLGIRVLLPILMLFLASIALFAVLHVLPGSGASTVLGVGATEEQATQYEQEIGADRPFVVQYLDWLQGFLTGSTTSLISQESFGDLVGPRAAITVPLTIAAFLLSVLVSFPVGILAAVYRRSPFGLAISALSQLGVAVPAFWIGMILIWVLSLDAGVFPAGGFPRQGWADVGGALFSLVLPAITVAVAMSSVMIRYIRSAVLDVLDAEFMRTARSLGYTQWQALARHGLRNASAPVVSILGIEFATALLGAVVIENVFALPGLGSLLLSSVESRDFPIVQNLVLLLTAVVLVTNVIVDLAQRAIDPRLRAAGGKEA